MNKETFYRIRCTSLLVLGIVSLLAADDSRRVKRIPDSYQGPIGTTGLLIAGIVLVALSYLYTPRASRNRAKFRKNQARSKTMVPPPAKFVRFAPMKARRTRCTNHAWRQNVVPQRLGESFFEWNDRCKAEAAARGEILKW